MSIYKILLFSVLSFCCFVAGFLVGQNPPSFINLNPVNDTKVSALSNRINSIENEDSLSNEIANSQNTSEDFQNKIRTMKEETEQLKQSIQKQLENQKEQQQSYQSLEQSSRKELDKKIKEKQKIIKKKQAEYDKKNRQWLLNLPKEQNYFYWKGRYSFLVNVFSDETEAMTYIKTFKTRYPLWNFFIKLDELANIKIYLGPFETRNKALEFMKSVSYPSPFPNNFLEEQPL